jgi:1-acyl-sn-glycerol-3-phosphate acyltransferase
VHFLLQWLARNHLARENMLDLERLRRMRLATRPLGQLVMANAGLGVDYRFPRRTEIVFEGEENVPRDRGVFFAMNHTDRYNYWPFQYWCYRRGLRFTATWVKGKYYENKALGVFMDSMNNIPLPSRGYVIASEFRKACRRAPSPDEYRLLRDLVDGERDPHAPLSSDASNELRAFLEPDERGPFLVRFDALFDEMVDQVIRLNREALFEKELNVLVFPQGTRNKRLLPGHTGLAQMSQHLRAPIVPVGCNGSDRCYPGNSPFSKGGHIVYRIGAPIEADGPELAPYVVPQAVRPLSREAAGYEEQYREITRVVMEKLDGLLDPEYRFSEDAAATLTRGVDRFL